MQNAPFCLNSADASLRACVRLMRQNSPADSKYTWGLFAFLVGIFHAVLEKNTIKILPPGSLIPLVTLVYAIIAGFSWNVYRQNAIAAIGRRLYPDGTAAFFTNAQGLFL